MSAVVFSRQIRKTRPFFLGADIVLVWLAFQTAYEVRSRLPLERVFYLTDSVKTLLTLASIVAWILAAIWVRAYDRVLPARWWTLAAITLRQSLFGVLAVLVFQYAQRLDLSRPFLALLGGFGFLYLLIGRSAGRAIAERMFGADASRRYVLVAGTDDRAKEAARLVERNARFGLELAGFLGDEAGQLRLSHDYPIYPLRELSQILRRQVVDEIVFAVDSSRLAELEDVFLLCDEEGVRTRVGLDFFPHVHSKLSLEHLATLPLLTFSAAPHDDPRLLVKRMADVTLALGTLAILSPVLLAIAALIRLTSPGAAIFRQQRCGLNGRRFTLLKFRTMGLDAEARKAELEHLNVKRTAFKIPNDPRLTGVGRWLRKFSLDELPQLWNVVRGEMSFVGPRPAVPEEVEKYERWQRRRLRMRPGLTCLWTLAGRDQLDFDEWMRLDLAYIDSWSLRLDWIIFMRTIPVVLLGRGAN